MLVLKRLPSLAKILAVEDTLTAEQQVEFQTTVRALVILQELPDIALVGLSGVYLPPHERTLIYQQHRGAGTTVVEASRGTAKSSALCVLYPLYAAAVIPRRHSVVLSATGLRGGQFLFQDGERWLNGGWDSQQQEIEFFRACYPRTPSPIHKAASHWTLETSGHSSIKTLPTKDKDKVRGVRGHMLFCDEVNTMASDLIEVVEPFLNVGNDMRHGGAYAHSNQICFVSTIDFGWRPFQEKIAAAKAGIQRDRMADACLRAGDKAGYTELAAKGLHQYSYAKFDYTDVLIRREITTRDGRQMRVTAWPDKEIPLTEDLAGIPFTARGEDGKMLLQGPAVEYWSTYSMQKAKIEEGLRDGSTDGSSWMAEQRNIVDTAIGDVFSNQLISAAACEGEHSIIPYKKLPEAWQGRYTGDEDDYVAPVLWTCSDPCVLGVDYAPVSDFSAFVVIRLGALASGTFDPFTHQGKTSWNNVIWAEQHQKMSAREVADKIRLLRGRYNLVWFHDPHHQDPWEVCRGIGLDMRGGGTAVRDELCWVSAETLPPGEVRIYDPLDKDEKILAFEKDQRSLPMLDTIWPQDQLNDRCVEYVKAQMETHNLYIGKYLEPHERAVGQKELHVGYEAMRMLTTQLRKIRQEPTQNARRFYMEGDTAKEKNKKDFFSAFLYAGKQMRAHIIRQRQIDDTPPPMGAVVTKIGGKRGSHGRAAGSRG